MNLNATLIGELIAFIVFVWFCMKFVWPPLNNAIEARQKKIIDGLAASDRAAKDLELAQEKATDQLKQAKAEAAGIVEAAKKREAKIVEEAAEKAEAEKAKIIAAGYAEIENERNQVQEELRKDDYNRWLKRYGPYAVAGIVAVVAAAGFYEWSKAQKEKTARATSASYIAAATAADGGNLDQAINDFIAISEKAPAGYSGLSLMRAAELELDKGNTPKAIAYLDQAAQAFELPRHKQLAQIKAIYILAGNGQYADVASRAAPLAEKDQPYEYLARELIGFAAKETGDLSEARRQFSYLNTIPGVPGSIQQRAKQYLDLMSVASLKSAEQIKSGAAPAEDAAPENDTAEPTE